MRLLLIRMCRDVIAGNVTAMQSLLIKISNEFLFIGTLAEQYGYGLCFEVAVQRTRTGRIELCGMLSQALGAGVPDVCQKLQKRKV